MELALSLDDSTPKRFSFLEKSSKKILGRDLGLICMAAVGKVCADSETEGTSEETASLLGDQIRRRANSSSDPPVQLDLLPFSPVQRINQPSSSNTFPFPWLSQNLIAEQQRGPEVNGRVAEDEEGPSLSSPKSKITSFQMDFSSFRSSTPRNIKRDFEQFTTANVNGEGEADRGSDEEENGSTRKKLRLSREQSAFLEDSFKDHNTLNPKEKLALAKQLNLRPRQVEVWFQNRRARTKLKQTEIDCEYLKRCCETLREENKRLQKEIQELRALKASKPFYLQLPATTLTMCPSCERVAAAAATATTSANATAAVAPAATTIAAASNKPNTHPKQAAS